MEKKNYYKWAVNYLLVNTRLTGIARLQAEAAKDHVETAEGLKVLLYALGYTDKGVAELVELVREREEIEVLRAKAEARSASGAVDDPASDRGNSVGNPNWRPRS